MAKPFFIDFIKALEKNEEIDFDTEARFSRPSGDIGIEMNCDEYQKNQFPLEEGGEEDFEDEGFSDDMFGDEEF
jgi:penicillin-binding protein 1A